MLFNIFFCTLCKISYLLRGPLRKSFAEACRQLRLRGKDLLLTFLQTRIPRKHHEQQGGKEYLLRGCNL